MALRWKDKRYSTGHPFIDSQHRELFDRVVALLRASEGPTRKAEFVSMVDFLGEYILEHFECEEALMDELACATREENRRDHEWFMQQFRALRAQFEMEGATEELRQALMGLVVQWMEVHIVQVDSRLREVTRNQEKD